MENKQLNNPSRSELITDFVKSNPEYYIEKFQQIGSKPTFSFSFNLYAAILGPIWFGMRNIWNWALAFLIIETFSVVQIIRGLFGNITAEAIQKIEQVQSTIAFRNKQLESAITSNPDKVDVYKRNIKSLEDAMQGYINEVDRIEASAIWITIFGIVLLISVKIVQGVLANSKLEKRYSEWLSDKSISPGMQAKNYVLSTIFTSVIMFFSVVHYSFPGLIVIMNEFPTHPDIRLTSIAWVEAVFNYAVLKGDALFTAITIGIRSVLDFLELLFVKTPWIVSFIRNSCNFKYSDWNSIRNLLCKTSKILFNDKTDNGFHANYASVRIHDSSHCILWNWKSCCSYNNNDIWWNTSC